MKVLVDKPFMQRLAKAVIKRIFSRFENLNLIVLAEDLRRNKVLFGDWIRYEWKWDKAKGLVDKSEHKIVCPVAHGWQGFPASITDDTQLKKEWASLSLLAGVTSEEAATFTDWWDDYTGESSKRSKRRRLLSIIQEIISERKENADVVQSVITEGGNNANNQRANEAIQGDRIACPLLN